jgi:sterol 3beta-glucosyltransferase
MRISLFAHGSRGDVWPIVALGWQLAARDHDVTVAVPGEFQAFTERAGLRTVALPFDLMTWLGKREGQEMLRSGGLAVTRGLGQEYSRHADAFDEAYEAAAHGAEALVATLMTLERTMALADLQRVPLAMVYQQPVAPSRQYSSLLLTQGRLRSPAMRQLSGKLAYSLWWRSNASATRAFRRKLGVSARARPAFYRLQDHRALGLHTVSPSLFPRPTDWPDNLKVTGAWEMPSALRESLGEELPADFQVWLDDGDPPIFLGFGSMPVLDPQSLFDGIVSVTGALGRRAIVSRNCVPRAVEALPEHLWAIDALDHDRLFPRCAAVVHHGGIGSTTASLRAGRPTMVCSVFADQPWWGERIRRLGVGTHLSFRRLDRDNLESGLRKLLDPTVAARAEQLGAAIRAEGDGLPEATQLLEDWLVVAEPTPSRRRASRIGVT